MEINEMTTDFVMQSVLQTDHKEITDRIIHYKSKDEAIGDAIRYLREADSLSVEDGLKIVRQLASKQFSAMIKSRKLMTAARQIS